MLPGASRVLTEEEIAHRLENRAGESSGEYRFPITGPLRRAAVLVPLLWHEDQWHLLFTRRAETLHSHKGQVSFPGGGEDPRDHGPEATALREAYEETGLLTQDVKVLGQLYRRPTISSFIVVPVVARIRWPYEFHLSTEEVSRIFTIPLLWLADPANREERQYSHPASPYETVIYYQPYDGEILWGATARITLDFLEVLQMA